MALWALAPLLILATQVAAETCRQHCPFNTHEWEVRCGWAGCSGCSQCTASGTSPPCRQHCPFNSHSWAARCGWAGCSGCSQCTASPPPAPSPAPPSGPFKCELTHRLSLTHTAATKSASVSRTPYSQEPLHCQRSSPSVSFPARVLSGPCRYDAVGRHERKTDSFMPYMPMKDGWFQTHSTYRFLTVREQVMTAIGEAKHGLWRFMTTESSASTARAASRACRLMPTSTIPRSSIRSSPTMHRAPI